MAEMGVEEPPRMRHAGESLEAAASHVVMSDLALNDGSGGLVAVDAQGLPPRWEAVARVAETLTLTPSTFSEAQIAELREAGLDDDEAVDAIFASAFFNWANRLMLSLGEPTPPAV